MMMPATLPTTLLATLVWGAASWRGMAIGIGVTMLVLLLWAYWRVRAPAGVRLAAFSLKAVGILILLLCLLEPLWSSNRAKQGANLFVVLTDNSRSMTLHDRGVPETRAAQLKQATTRPSEWLERVGEDFDLRVHAFDTKLHPTTTRSDAMPFDGDASNLGAALTRTVRQYQGRPLAGMVVLTDGNATDAEAIDRLLDSPEAKKLPPIYPVLIGQDGPAGDINLRRVDVSQTDFEDAPVTVSAQLTTDGYKGRTLVAQLLDQAGKAIDQQTLKVDADGAPLSARFKVRPDDPGVSFYRVRVAEEGQLPTLDAGAAAYTGAEATLANNTRQVVVDRGRGPYRVLYVAGRPNWEFKFLQRSIEPDDQVQLVGLIRIAKREPKFAYLGRDGSNPLFRGFEGQDKEQAEQYDQPVLVRIGTRDGEELRGGFPRNAEELNGFHAIILDDVEAEFFTQDQLQLIKEFVRQRGGALLMLGGQESFREGNYDRTAVGDLLPVYAAGETTGVPDTARFRMSLTREGWLAPWVRLRPDETAERSRFESMPSFQTLNGVRGIKPGATVLATADVLTESGDASAGQVPALVEQRFGKGRAAALLIGDLWRWSLGRPQDAPDDMGKAWRQTVRWLVSDVPRRVELTAVARQNADDPDGARVLAVRVRDSAFAPQDNAAVALHITTPDGQTVDLTAEASAAEAGLYEATYVPRQPGAYRVKANAAAPDGKEIAAVEAGWTTDPTPDEFNELRPNRALLERLATKTGGQMVALADLNGFARSLPARRAEITEPEITPLWHRPWVFGLAIACLAAEWGLRRLKGLP